MDNNLRHLFPYRYLGSEFDTSVDFGLKVDQYTVEEHENRNMSAPALAITLSMFGTVLCSVAFIW